jgi:hypothetical protein
MKHCDTAKYVDLNFSIIFILRIADYRELSPDESRRAGCASCILRGRD